jgi:hypothetical protein
MPSFFISSVYFERKGSWSELHFYKCFQEDADNENILKNQVIKSSQNCAANPQYHDKVFSPDLGQPGCTSFSVPESSESLPFRITI